MQRWSGECPRRWPRRTRSSASEPEIRDRLLERVDVDLPQSGHELVIGKAAKESVDHALEVGDPTLRLGRQPHVFKSLVVQAFLLLRQVGEVLPRDRRPARV